ncbi:MAG: hypothetical protein K9I94_14460 [Bacteroidales bacterium]|nr:hypothetical protein [Bacteroidales bacterium]
MAKGKKVIFIDSTHPHLPQALERLGFVCESFPGYSRGDYLQIIGNYSGIIVRSGIEIDRELLSLAGKLEFIGRVGAGMENIDREYAESIGVHCLNAPEGNRDAVAEQAMGMLLMLMNKLLKADSEVRKGVWLREENRGVELKDKVIGIIGFGNTGSEFARRLMGFGVKIFAYDKYKTGYAPEYVQESDMETIFREADILSLHVPLAEDTHYLVNSGYLARFSKPVYLINTSRGKVVKTDDLVEGLKNGKVLGAALDVLEYEGLTFENIEWKEVPTAFKYLVDSDRVVLSPHIAGWTVESKFKLAHTLVEKIKRIYE